jgi:predicted nucleotidyltransferase component of viral defense system
VRDDSGINFAFDREDRQKRVNSHTFYLKYNGPLPAGNDAKVDITVRERLIFPLDELPILRGYHEFADVPENRLIRGYSLEEIATEKIVALVDKARNEPRDLYDLWHLTSNQGIQLDHLTDAICQKLEFRGKPCKDLEAAILQKEARLKALWSVRLTYQMTKLPSFDEVFRAIRRALRQANLP